MALIEITNLKKHFGVVKAVDGIDLEINNGEIVGFLGPNGAGKTTTISCMLGLLKPDFGSIKINGFDAWTESTMVKQDFGFIPADPYFYGDWTGKDHLEYFKKINGKTELLTALVKDFDFNPKIKVKNLSTGNRQKLSIIIAMMHSPKLLLMDEPTRGLDPLLQNTFYKYLRQLNKTGTTIFMSSHNLPEVEAICSRVAIIKSGQLVEVGDIKSLQSKRVHMVNLSLKKPEGFNSKLLKKFGAEVMNKYDHTFELKVTGDLNDLLAEAIKLGIISITITNANLEEIFLEFYK